MQTGILPVHAADMEWHDHSRESLAAGFSYLRIEDFGTGSIAFNPAITDVVMKKRMDLEPSHPLFMQAGSEGLEENDILLLVSAIKEKGEKYYVLFSEGASYDLHFYFVKVADGKVFKRFLSGSALAIPGNGNVYVAGRANNTFTARYKYRLTASGLERVFQPWQYVGLKSKTLVTVTLYALPSLENPVATLPANTEVEVLLAHRQGENLNKTIYLVKTPFGLVGWVNIPASQYKATVIDGISFWGD